MENLMICPVCGEKQEKIFICNGISHKVKCMCRCEVEEEEARKEEERLEEIETARRVCFNGTNMKAWSFDNDDGKNPKMSAAMKKYADDFTINSKGLLLYGPVGTGKTYFTACIANALLERGFRVLMTNFTQLAAKARNEGYIESLNRYSLLIIDDLGVERKTEYMQEMVFNIIDSRYRSGKPMIITTNLTADEIKKPDNVGYERIYDRLMERCIILPVTGQSRRKKELIDTYTADKERLGLD